MPIFSHIVQCFTITNSQMTAQNRHKILVMIKNRKIYVSLLYFVKKGRNIFNSSGKQNFFLTGCIYQKGHTIFFLFFLLEKGVTKNDFRRYHLKFFVYFAPMQSNQVSFISLINYLEQVLKMQCAHR